MSATIIGHGVDIVSANRMKDILERQGQAFKDRVFTKKEQSYCEEKANPELHYAARFAAKEAYAKALGLGVAASGRLVEMGVLNEDNGRPILNLEGLAREKFEAKYSNSKIHLSLSHDAQLAIASVVIWGEEKCE